MQSVFKKAQKLSEIADSKIIIKSIDITKLKPLAASNYKLLNWNDVSRGLDSLTTSGSYYSSTILRSNKKLKIKTESKEIGPDISQLEHKYRTLNSVYFRIIPKVIDSKCYEYEMLREHKLKYTLHSTEVIFGNPKFTKFAEKRFDRIENELEDKEQKYRINHEYQREQLLCASEPLHSIPSPKGNLKLKYLESN